MVGSHVSEGIFGMPTLAASCQEHSAGNQRWLPKGVHCVVSLFRCWVMLSCGTCLGVWAIEELLAEMDCELYSVVLLLRVAVCVLVH